MSLIKSGSAIGLFLRQAQSVIAFTYVLMIGTGMAFYQQKYSEFGINIFQYADIFYFLVAPFEDSLILVLCALLVFIMGGSILFERVASKKYPRLYSIMHFGLNKKSWFPTYQAIFYPLSVIIVYFMYSDAYGSKSKEEIMASDPVTIIYSDDTTISAKMIGKTTNVIFLLEGNDVKAIPLEAIKEIGIKTFPKTSENTTPAEAAKN